MLLQGTWVVKYALSQGWNEKDWGSFNHLVLTGLIHLILTNFD